MSNEILHVTIDNLRTKSEKQRLGSAFYAGTVVVSGYFTALGFMSENVPIATAGAIVAAWGVGLSVKEGLGSVQTGEELARLSAVLASSNLEANEQT